MSVSEEDIAKAMSPPEPEPFGIWEENWPTWRVFTYLADQWRHVSDMRGTRRVGGPPPSEIESTVRMMGLPRADRLTAFLDIKDMVFAVLAVDLEDS